MHDKVGCDIPQRHHQNQHQVMVSFEGIQVHAILRKCGDI